MKEDFTSRFFSNHTTDIAKFYNEMENSSYMYKVHLTQRSYWLSRIRSKQFYISRCIDNEGYGNSSILY